MKSKMKLIAALKIWVVIYPSITIFNLCFGKVLSDMPLLLRTFILTISLVPWMMFVGLPFVDLLLKVISVKSKSAKQKK